MSIYSSKASTRMSSLTRRPAAALGVVALVAGAGIALTATPASAALPSGGYLVPTPSTGTNNQALTFNSSGPCTDPNATNIQVKMFGSGFPAGGQVVVGNGPTSAYAQNANGGYIVTMGQTLQDFANVQSPVATFSGPYQFVMTCRTNTSGTSLGDYTTKVFFTSGTAYQSTGPSAASSTTALTPSGDGFAGHPQTLTAQVTPSAGGPATGWVEFYDGTTKLTDPVALNASGQASTSQTFAAGAHSLTAVYTPDDTALFTGSTSPAASWPITTAPATNTATTLVVSPAGTAAAYATVTMNATIDQPAAGSVAFKDAGTTLQTVPVTVGASTATAQFATSFASAGSHSFTAVFTPTNPGAYNGSTSSATSYEITAPSTAPVTETITVAIAPGSLTLSIANNPNVVLTGAGGGAAELNAAGDLLVAAGTLNPVTVTDTRAQDQGPTHWTVSGSVVDFTDGAGHAISGNDLGWTPTVVAKAATQTVTEGAAIAPAHGVAPGGSADPVNGLRTSRVLAFSDTGSPTGSARVTADLLLNAPTNTVPSTAYSTTLTITAA